MGKVYRFLGLTVGLVIHDVQPKDRKALLRPPDITYGTNNEFGFDYLRDNMCIYATEMVQRGHAFAIVDEVDSILIDEGPYPPHHLRPGETSPPSCTPSWTTLSPPERAAGHQCGHQGGEDPDVDADYIVDEKARTVTLTARGVQEGRAAVPAGETWPTRRTPPCPTTSTRPSRPGA